jgi:hypothetical protein
MLRTRWGGRRGKGGAVRGFWPSFDGPFGPLVGSGLTVGDEVAVTLLNWIVDFFRAMPEVFRALYFHGDPTGAGQGWWGFVILFIWAVFFTAIPLAIAKRFHGEREWMTATMASVAVLSISWWVFGIIPSATVYFFDGNAAVLADRVIPTSFAPFGIPIATDLYHVIRDSVVMGSQMFALVGLAVAAFAVQKRYPRTLEADEPRRESSGGYR